MSEIKKIYVVSTHDGCEYLLWGLFSTPDLARAAMELRGDESWNDIQEVELDSLDSFQPDPPRIRRDMHVAKVRIADGVVFFLETEDTFSPKEGVRVNAGFGDQRDHVLSNSLVSMAHAVEMAMAARAIWLKNQEGKVDCDSEDD